MNKTYRNKEKVKRKTHTWIRKDTKATIVISLVLIILFCIPYFGGFDFLRNKQLEGLGGSTEGLVLSIKDNEHNNQRYNGGSFEAISFTVKYTYTIAGKKYVRDCTFPYDGEYKIYRRKLYKGKKLRIAYKINQPEKSTILYFTAL